MIKGALDALPPPVLIREKAFEEIRGAIIAGRLAPGTRLIERELCEALGISRASVREVIRRLEAERLVTVEPRRGPTVVVLTTEEAAEIYEVRAMLESLVVRRFTERATEAEIVALEGIFSAVREAASANAIERIVLLMQQFNQHLTAVSGLSIARDLLAQLDARISWLRVKAMAAPGRLPMSLEEMSDILKLVRQRDAVAASARMGVSVLNARDAAVAQIASSATAVNPSVGKRRKR